MLRLKPILIVVTGLVLLSAACWPVLSPAADKKPPAADAAKVGGESELTHLEQERNTVVSQFGKSHPRVAQLDAMIASLKAQMRQPGAVGQQGVNGNFGGSNGLQHLRDRVPKMNDEELRLTVQVLIDRLTRLEQQVSVMNQPRVHLLDR